MTTDTETELRNVNKDLSVLREDFAESSFTSTFFKNEQQRLLDRRAELREELN